VCLLTRQTGGYNLEATKASNQRLIALILLIALAYSCATFAGRKLKHKGVQNYIGRTQRIKT